MAKPVSGQLGYDNAADRPTVELRVGTRKLLTEDDAGGGGAVSDVTGSGAIDVSPTTGNVVVSLDESELENGGAQELDLTGLGGVLADPQKADKLVESSGPTTLSVGSISDGQILQRSGSSVVGVTGVLDNWYFWVKAPASPNADDDEFTSSALNARWTPVKQGTWTAATPSGPVDAVGPVSTANFNMTPNYRGTHLAWQGCDGGILRTFTMPAALQIRFRIDPGSVGVTSGATAASFVNLYCGPWISSAPDMTNNYARWGWTNGATSGSVNWLSTGREAGGGGFDVTGPNMFGMTKNMEFILLIKNGKAFWYLRQGPSLDRINEHTVNGNSTFGTGVTAYIYLRFNGRWSVLNSGQISNIQTCDYIRIRTDDDLEAY